MIRDALAAAITAALRRTWEPADLRASVPSLTWNDLGRRAAQRVDKSSALPSVAHSAGGSKRIELAGCQSSGTRLVDFGWVTSRTLLFGAAPADNPGRLRPCSRCDVRYT